MRSFATLLSFVALFISLATAHLTNKSNHSSRNARHYTGNHLKGHVKRQTSPVDVPRRNDPVVYSSGSPLTNSERLKRGLTPNAPAHFIQSSVNGRIRSVPSPTRFTRGAPSQGPSTSGLIKVIKLRADGSEDETLGYVAAALTTYKESTITEDKKGALKVKIPTSGSSPFPITSTNGDATFSYLGAILNEYNRPDFATGDWSWAYLGATAHSAPNSKPSAAGNSRDGAPVESSIWYYDSSTKQITAKWVNSDGTAWSETTIAYQTTQQYLFIAGDLAQFNHVTNGDFGVSVGVKFVFEADV